jgi:aspartyl-tRNA(Asn)/glutamyl-tRNA(Gln) amidotransferase subunit C
VSLSADDVRHVARLARLALSDEQVETMRAELSAILSYAEQVQEVVAADVPPTAHAYPIENVLRPDDPTPTLPRDQALANAPASEDGWFQVPAILDEEQ